MGRGVPGEEKCMNPDSQKMKGPRQRGKERTERRCDIIPSSKNQDGYLYRTLAHPRQKLCSRSRTQRQETDLSESREPLLKAELLWQASPNAFILSPFECSVSRKREWLPSSGWGPTEDMRVSPPWGRHGMVFSMFLYLVLVTHEMVTSEPQ